MRRGALLLLLAACTSPGGSQDAGADARDAAAPLSGASGCADVVACAGRCDASDDACLRECALRTPNATDLANELLHCLDANTCFDAACVRTSCAAQVTACLQDGATRLAPQGTPSVGAVPAEYEGTWTSFATRWTIGPSGAVTRRRTLAARGCAASLEESGVALQLNERLAIAYRSGTLDVCGLSGAFTPFDEQYEHSLASGGTVLVLHDLGCQGAPDSCTSRFAK
jgi:hypothetical protein